MYCATSLYVKKNLLKAELHFTAEGWWFSSIFPHKFQVSKKYDEVSGGKRLLRVFAPDCIK